ncbi:MAG: NAD(P)H-dependent oxidoreductase [Candidatus Omnitrophota bacterium]|nr:NAD(P)H-dependent oxidoreductase [Candidatus Omnitrophota bacterium]
MKKLLHIIATPREDESRTLQVSNTFLKALKEKHPDLTIEELNLFKEELPSLTLKRVDGKYILLGGKDLSGEFKEAWEEIISHIERFLSADAYLLSVPMWNFGIPYKLKHYIDIIIQPKYLFRYTEKGPEGLVKGKKMAVVTSRGGDYSAGGMRQYDTQEPYLRAIFGFVGITDIIFINAQPMDMGPELQKEKIEEAQAIARKTAESF